MIAQRIDYAKHRSRSHDAVIRVYDDAGNVIETHEPAGEFRESWRSRFESSSETKATATMHRR